MKEQPFFSGIVFGSDFSGCFFDFEVSHSFRLATGICEGGACSDRGAVQHTAGSRGTGEEGSEWDFRGGGATGAEAGRRNSGSSGTTLHRAEENSESGRENHQEQKWHWLPACKDELFIKVSVHCQLQCIGNRDNIVK